MIKRLPRGVKDLLIRMGCDLRLGTEDRNVLEKVIFPLVLARPDFERVLFVGCDWYTAGYRRVFASREHWTIEIDPERTAYGSARHIVDGVQNVGAHFAPVSLDAIFFNGVFGVGLNERAEVDATFRSFYECLRLIGIWLERYSGTQPVSPFGKRGFATVRSL